MFLRNAEMVVSADVVVGHSSHIWLQQTTHVQIPTCARLFGVFRPKTEGFDGAYCRPGGLSCTPPRTLMPSLRASPVPRLNWSSRQSILVNVETVVWTSTSSGSASRFTHCMQQEVVNILVTLYVGGSYAIKVPRSILFYFLLESGLVLFRVRLGERWVGNAQAARLQHPLGCS